LINQAAFMAICTEETLLPAFLEDCRLTADESDAIMKPNLQHEHHQKPEESL